MYESGHRIGPYQLVERLGEGGMGEVYRAERLEDFAQTVAIKFLVHGLGDAEIESRFRTEQQVLASLNHRNIVRLLDAGVSNEGAPFIVMEYVEGIPLDRWCADRQAGLETRLGLLIQVLEALEYAHQRFLVHCDLKYSNILVTPDGAVKLLDFGISKLLRPSQFGLADSPTREFRPLTLEFASPEQLVAGNLSTGSDIYACGVLLYGMLTGQHPFEDLRNRPVALAEAMQNSDVELPSRRARRLPDPPIQAGQLDGDLDAIVAKALRKEPEARYRSAERFVLDLRRYLDGLPVEARAGTLVYRAAKFVRRNRAMAFVAGVLAIAALLGVAGTIAASVRAQQERRLAEARFNDTRKLADSLLFGFYDSISKLPGAAHAQHMIVTRSLKYLDNLARESNGNEGLQIDLADGYVKLATVSTGFDDALNAADNAIRISQSLARSLPRDVRAFTTLANAHGARAEALRRQGRNAEAQDEERRSAELLREAR